MLAAVLASAAGMPSWSPRRHGPDASDSCAAAAAAPVVVAAAGGGGTGRAGAGGGGGGGSNHPPPASADGCGGEGAGAGEGASCARAPRVASRTRGPGSGAALSVAFMGMTSALRNSWAMQDSRDLPCIGARFCACEHPRSHRCEANVIGEQHPRERAGTTRGAGCLHSSGEVTNDLRSRRRPRMNEREEGRGNGELAGEARFIALGLDLLP